MIKIKINQKEGRNTAPPIDNPEEPIHTQTKISGFGASNDYTKTSGHDFNPAILPRYGMEECHCGCENCQQDDDMEIVLLPDDAALDDPMLYEKKDRCYHLAKRKYKVFPSAYASGFIVRCRKGKVARKKNESLELEEMVDFILNEESLELEEIELDEGTFDKEKSQGLHGWFARKGGKGKSKGWVDCNTCRTNPETGRKTCKTCGRQSGEKRGKYPACRPTPSACNRRGTSKKRGPTRVSWKKKKKEE